MWSYLWHHFLWTGIFLQTLSHFYLSECLTTWESWINCKSKYQTLLPQRLRVNLSTRPVSHLRTGLVTIRGFCQIKVCKCVDCCKPKNLITCKVVLRLVCPPDPNTFCRLKFNRRTSATYLFWTETNFVKVVRTWKGRRSAPEQGKPHSIEPSNNDLRHSYVPFSDNNSFVCFQFALVPNS